MSHIEATPATQDRSKAALHRRHRHRRLTLAWGTSLLSKVATAGVQFLAVPLVYHALGQTGYAAYAAVTASAVLITALNLGIGGSLVTPIAEAAAQSDERRQAVLVQAGLGPLVALCLLGAMVVLPVICLTPLRTLFGRVGASGYPELRTAVVIAAIATLTAVPFSAVMFLRQAYQEMHISNLVSAVTNGLLCIGLLLAARRSNSVAVFVALFVLMPLIGQAINLTWLFCQRKFLLRGISRKSLRESRHLLGDGVRFVAADFAGMLLYQWPVYWIARTEFAATSSWFAICMQATVLQLVFGIGFMMPIWPSTADAVARRDYDWLHNTIRKGRIVITTVGIGAFLAMLFLGQRMIDLWLRKPLRLEWPVRGLMGLYVLLALWEFYHLMLAYGFGHLREAASAVFFRSVAFALALPLLMRLGGVPLLWCGLCCSALWTAWRLPRLIRVPVHTAKPDFATP